METKKIEILHGAFGEMSDDMYVTIHGIKRARTDTVCPMCGDHTTAIGKTGCSTCDGDTGRAQKIRQIWRAAVTLFTVEAYTQAKYKIATLDLR